MQLRGQKRRPGVATSSASSLAPRQRRSRVRHAGWSWELAGIGVALVVTAYFLLDGRRTFHLSVAFVPARSRGRAHETAECGRQIIEAYIRGNIITSLLAAPALLLGLTVSPTVAPGVTLFYVAYSMVERTITSNPKYTGAK